MQQQLMQARGAWTGLPRRAQLAILGVIAVTAVVMYLVLRAATAADWTVVARDLSADKAGRAQTALEEAGFQVRIDETGTAVEVPQEVSSKAAATLMSAGIAAKGGRVDCAKQFSEGGSVLAQTSAQHAVKLETCQESQAANDIEQIDGVNKASVDVTLTPKTLFQEDESPAKASVFVDADGTPLARRTVQGIQQSVAARFDGLAPDMVVITDETGSTISRGSGDDGADGADKLKTEAEYNAQVERRLMTVLEEIAGPGNVKIISNVELDMDSIKREAIDAGGEEDKQGPLESETYKKELLNGATTGEAAEGVAGAGSNQGVDPDNRNVTPTDAPAGDDEGDYLGDEAARTYVNDKVAEVIDVAPGSVVRFRMSAIVDDSVPEATANAVKNAIQAWMGGNAQDSFSFDQAPIAAAVPVEAGPNPQVAAIRDYMKWALLAIGLVGLAFVLRRALTQRTAELLAPADDMLMLEPGGFTPIPLAELEAAIASAQPNADRRSRIELQRKVEQIAEAKPDDVANELRRWMHQDDQAYAPTGRRAS